MEAYEKYKVGETYTLKVLDLCKDRYDNDYLSLEGLEGERLIVYRPLKYQYEDLPSEVPVIVRRIDSNGRVHLKQDLKSLFEKYYKVGKYYIFYITSVNEDKNKSQFCYLEDSYYAEHRYYFKEDEDLEIGEPIILEVVAIDEKGFLKLKKHEKFELTESQPQIESAYSYINQEDDERYESLTDIPILEGVGGESTTVEFKTSIAFPPGGNGEADIDKQLDDIIRKVLCAFMNTEGGKLYIGIHDKTKKIVGFKDDYAYLNDGEDVYAGQYGANIDSYERKIRNAVYRRCSHFATDLLEFEFPEVNGAQYCCITVKKADEPVWFKGVQLWRRSGCGSRQIHSDEITSLIKKQTIAKLSNLIDLSPIMDELKKLNKRRTIPTSLPKPKDPQEIEYWINWFENGSWKRTKEKLEGEEYVKHVAVTKGLNNAIVVFCYKTGRVNTIGLSVFRKGANLNDRIVAANRLWYEGQQPMEIFIVDKMSLLVGYSVDEHGAEHVKYHELTDFTPRKSSANQGVSFLPEANSIVSFHVISAAHGESLKALRVSRKERASNPGTPLDSKTYGNELEYLHKLISDDEN